MARWSCLAFGCVSLAFAPSPQSGKDVLAKGLLVWREPGAIQSGAACATCHSPDGIELAEYAFDDADIRRRALPHVSPADADLLVSYIHALRSKLHIVRLRDPNLDRPLQPGGTVLPGSSPAERDLSFGLELQTKLPRLFLGPVETIDQAKAAERDLLSVSATNLRIGVPLNRLSEDIAHGNEHSSIAQWLPELPPSIPEKDLPDWYAEEDRYLDDPSAAELHQLLLLQTRLVDTSHMLGLGEMSDLKFRALLVLQDRMRHQSEHGTANVSPDVLAYGNYNPIWEVGECAREIIDRSPKAIGMDLEIAQKKLAGPPLGEQLRSARVSWFWAGWLSDQGLFKTSQDDETRLGMWFSESLSKDGPYPFHDVYANARRQAVVSNDPEAWGETLNRRRRIWDFAGLRSFRRYMTDLPTPPNYRKLYVRFTENCFLMNMLLLEADMERTNQVWRKPNSKAAIEEMVNFIRTQDPGERAFAEKLEARLFGLIDRAVQRL